MVPPGNVAVGRTGGMISGTYDRLLAIWARICATDMPNQFRWNHGPTSTQSARDQNDGSIMRRAIAMAAAAISLAGCSSASNYFSSAPPTVQVQLESTPPGADARTSIGPGCKTPCSVAITPPDSGFTVSYSMAGREPATVPVQVMHTEGSLFSSGTVKVTPNPVITELQPTAPPPKPKPMRPKRKKPAAAPAAAAPPAAGGAFPDPNQPAAPPPPPQR
jgi:hypothetical protein